MTWKQGTKNKGQNKQPTNLLIKPCIYVEWSHYLPVSFWRYYRLSLFQFYIFFRISSSFTLLFAVCVVDSLQDFLSWLVILGVCLWLRMGAEKLPRGLLTGSFTGSDQGGPLWGSSLYQDWGCTWPLNSPVLGKVLMPSVVYLSRNSFGLPFFLGISLQSWKRGSCPVATRTVTAFQTAST